MSPAGCLNNEITCINTMNQECCSSVSIFYPSTISTSTQDCTTTASTTTTTKKPVIVYNKCYSYVPVCEENEVLIQISTYALYCCIWPNCVVDSSNNQIMNFKVSGNLNDENIDNKNNTTPTTETTIRAPVTRPVTKPVELPTTKLMVNPPPTSEPEDEIISENVEDSESDLNVPSNSDGSNISMNHHELLPYESLENCSSTSDACGRKRFYIFNFLRIKIYCCLEGDENSNTQARFSAADNVVDEVVADCSRSTKSCLADETLVKVAFVLDFWCCVPVSKWAKQHEH